MIPPDLLTIGQLSAEDYTPQYPSLPKHLAGPAPKNRFFYHPVNILFHSNNIFNLT
jgi:hypothetical protein